MDANSSGMNSEALQRRLHEGDVNPDPFLTFAIWYQEAQDAKLHEPHGMTLATVGADGHPSARIVLLRQVDPRGFCFFTNYESRKGQELASNPWATLLLWWGPLERQVRIEGQVERLSDAESDAYYNSRPKGSRLGAWASPQSRVISSRQLLEDRLAIVEKQYSDQEPQRPAFWGGFRLVPTAIEFWQAGPHRLHDRLRYRSEDHKSWTIERLAP